MDERDWLAEQFEEQRTHLKAVAYRMLGSLSEADDAVQEAWIRLSRSDADEIRNLRAWPTTVVARVSLNMLKSRSRRREEPMDLRMPEPIVDSADGTDPDPDLEAQREVVDAFLAAAREGDFERLVAVLDPDVVSRGDFGPGVPLREVRGAEAVASNALMFQRLGLEVRPALINGAVGAVSMRGGKPFSIGAVTVRNGKIVELDFFADPERLARLDLTILDG